MSRQLFTILSILILTGLACSFSFTSENAPANDNLPENVLFSDDFSDPTTGWGEVHDSNGTLVDYDDGQYHIIVNYTTNFYWGVTGRVYPNDVRVEVDATPQAGTPEAAPFGIICRYSNQGNINNFYMLTISSNGYAVIIKIESNNMTILSEGLLSPSSAIRTGMSTNHLRADCIGSALTLYANGTEILSVTDSTFASGDVGLVAGTGDYIGTDILFDDFLVTQP